MVYTVKIDNREFRTNSIQKLVNSISKGDSPKEYEVIY